MTSLSGTGTTTITLQFDLSRNIDGAAQDVQTAINAAGGLLPKDLPTPPTYKKVNPADFPVLIYAVTSDAVPVYKLDDYAYTILAQQLSTVPGVSQVGVFGQKQYARASRSIPASLPPAASAWKTCATRWWHRRSTSRRARSRAQHKAMSLDTNDQLFNASQYGDVIITYKNGAPVRVKDVGQAVNSVQNLYVGAWFNNRPAEGIAIERASGANTIDAGGPHQGADAASRGGNPAQRACQPDVGPLADHPRRGARRADDDGHHRSAWWCW